MHLHSSHTETVVSTSGEPLTATALLSLSSKLPESWFQKSGPPSVRGTRLLYEPCTLHRSNAVRRSTAVSPLGPSQPQPHVHVDIEEITSNDRRRQQSSACNFCRPAHHRGQSHTMKRYYALALTPIDRAALARGDENHNLKPWTPKDLILHEERRKELIPANMYVGRDKQVCIIPDIVMTAGENELAHAQQLSYECLTYNAPPISSPEDTAQTKAYGRATSDGGFSTAYRRTSGFFSTGSRVRIPSAADADNYKHSDPIAFDKIPVSDHSGKGGIRRDARTAKLTKTRKS